MGTVSTIKRLDPRIKEAVDEAIRDGRATIDEILRLIRSLGGDVSRSAVGRYKQSMEEAMETFRASQEMAKVWVEKLGSEPETDAGRLAAQILSMVAMHTAREAMNSGEAMPATDLMMASKALEHLGRYNKVTLETALRARKEAAAEAAAIVEDVAKQGGISEETVQEIRRRVLGIV